MAYVWTPSGDDGGGRGNACAIDPNNSQNAAVAGDVWGTRVTNTQGNLWIAKMQGQQNMVYGRAVAFSAKHPGRTYWGTGTLKGSATGGAFQVQDPSNYQLTDTSFPGFSSNLASGAAGFYPRATGNRIVVDYDSGTNTEYVYAQANTGIFRAVDTSGSLANATTFPGTAPSLGAGLSMCMAPDGSLYAIEWGSRSSDTSASGQTMWHITNPRGTPVVSTIAGPSGLGPWNHLRTIGGVVYLACANGIAKLASGSWQALSGNSFFSGCVVSDVDGAGQVLYAATGDHPAGSAKAVAKSTNAGTSWTWVTTNNNFSQTVQGTNRQFWLTAFNIQRGLTGDQYGTNQMSVSSDGNFILLSGARGAFTSLDGGSTWHPSVNGLMGTEVNNIKVGTGGEAWNSDTDWVTAHTTDHYQTVTELSSAQSYGAAALTRTANGHTWKVAWTGSFYDVTKDGVSIADQTFKGAIVNPTDLGVSTDNYVYVSQFGGGVFVGNPNGGTTTVVPPTTGAPTLSTLNPVVGQPVTAFPNASTWDGTPPLTFTYQWQRGS